MFESLLRFTEIPGFRKICVVGGDDVDAREEKASKSAKPRENKVGRFVVAPVAGLWEEWLCLFAFVKISPLLFFSFVLILFARPVGHPHETVHSRTSYVLNNIITSPYITT